jgi:hypothetical protein
MPKKLPTHTPEPMYCLINQDSEVFVGLLGGYAQWSNDLSQAKPLYKEHTSMLLRYYPNIELIEEKELI